MERNYKYGVYGFVISSPRAYKTIFYLFGVSSFLSTRVSLMYELVSLRVICREFILFVFVRTRVNWCKGVLGEILAKMGGVRTQGELVWTLIVEEIGENSDGVMRESL